MGIDLDDPPLDLPSHAPNASCSGEFLHSVKLIDKDLAADNCGNGPVIETTNQIISERRG
jgi:hypothetical protein